MKRRLVCPNQHTWTIADSREKSLALPRCPECAELPGLGSMIGWEWNALSCLGSLFLLVLPMILFAVGLVVFRPRVENRSDPIVLTVAGIQVAWFFVLGWWFSGGPSDLKNFASSIDMKHFAQLSEERVRCFPSWPVKDLIVQRGFAIIGRFGGTHVVLANVARRTWLMKKLTKSRRLINVTIVAFCDTIAGLPDFDIEPIPDRNSIWNWDLFELWRLQTKPPLNNEPFGSHYRLLNCPPETLDAWLTPSDRDKLASHPGWAIQARKGQIVMFKPNFSCPASGVPTLLAVACHIHRLFLKGDVVE